MKACALCPLNNESRSNPGASYARGLYSIKMTLIGCRRAARFQAVSMWHRPRPSPRCNRREICSEYYSGPTPRRGNRVARDILDFVVCYPKNDPELYFRKRRLKHALLAPHTTSVKVVRETPIRRQSGPVWHLPRAIQRPAGGCPGYSWVRYRPTFRLETLLCGPGASGN